MIERIPQQPPVIKPVSDAVQRPLWSVMIPTFNCSGYLVQTLKSVLAQDRGPDEMQIEVIDDFSTDADVEALVKEIGQGRVGFYRQPQNVGSLRNFETCLNRATGHQIHLLHGDDQIRPGFYDEIESLFNAYPEVGAAFTGFTYIDEDNERLYDNHYLQDGPGVLENWLIRIASAQMVQPPAMVVRRYVYEKLGSFYAVHYGEDWEMWVRIAAHYPVAHSPKMLALYRVHQNNITSRSFLSGQSLKDALQVVELMQPFLPEKERARARRSARKHLAVYFARTSDKIYHAYGQPSIAAVQAKRAMDVNFSATTFFYWIKIRLKILMGYKMSKDRKWRYSPFHLFK